jgi:CBS domain containing-hemolysin-like protein
MDAEQRLSDVVDRIRAVDATHCVVVERESDHFIGIVRLKEVAASSTDRISADLVSHPVPLDVQETLEASLVGKILVARGSHELVVLSPQRKYVGLITRESFLEWRLAQRME